MRRPASALVALCPSIWIMLCAAACRPAGSPQGRPSPEHGPATATQHPALFPITSKGDPERYGFIDAAGRVIIAPKFEYASGFTEGLALVNTGEEQVAIDTDGHVVFVVPPRFITRGWFSEGLALVNVGGSEDHHMVEGGKWGYIDRQGRLAIPATFEVPAYSGYDMSMSPVSMFSEGLAGMVSPEGKWGFIDRAGAWVVPPRFDAVGQFNDGLALVGTGDHPRRKHGYIDRSGRLVIPMQFDDAAGFGEGLAAVAQWRDDAGSGFIDRTGRLVVEAHPAAYHEGDTGFHEGLAAVFAFPPEALRPDAKCPHCERAVGGMRPGQACPGCEVRLGERGLGFIDRAGRFVIPPTLWEGTQVQPFSEGLCAFTGENGKWGYMDRTGVPVIAPRFDEADSFEDGLARVEVHTEVAEPGEQGTSLDLEWGYVNRHGGVVWWSAAVAAAPPGLICPPRLTVPRRCAASPAGCSRSAHAQRP